MGDKINLEFIGSNGGGSIIEGNISLDTEEVEKIECKKGSCLIFFPGVLLSVPLTFCTMVHEAVEAAMVIIG
jgi:hypothetical protein